MNSSKASYSLFEGDLADRILDRISDFFCKVLRYDASAHERSGWDVVGLVSRIVFLVALTYGVQFYLAWLDGVIDLTRAPAEVFIFDYAAIAQLLIGIPIFVVARYLIDKSTSRCIGYFMNSGIIPESQLVDTRLGLSRVQKVARHPVPEIILVVLAYAMTLPWILTEIGNGTSNWLALVINGVESPTLCGLWAGFIAVPIYQFLWLRLVWKLILWSWALLVLAKRVVVKPTHADNIGGLKPLVSTQSSFALLAFAIGMIVSATLLYKVNVQGADIGSYSMWGVLLAYVILTPILFTAPMMVFTPVLKETKLEYLAKYNRLSVLLRTLRDEENIASVVEKDGKGELKEDAGSHFDYYTQVDEDHRNIRTMRIIPYDFDYIKKLFSATIAPIIPVLWKLDLFPSGMKEFFEKFGS